MFMYRIFRFPFSRSRSRSFNAINLYNLEGSGCAMPLFLFLFYLSEP